MLSDFEQRWASHKEGPGINLNFGAEHTAAAVDPLRIQVPAVAGGFDPASVLPEPLRSQLLESGTRVLQHLQSLEPPKFCYRVAASDELALREKLLASGMAVLLPEPQIPLTHSGRPLLAGLFSVAHKPSFDNDF